MDLEKRVQQLEEELEILKSQIQTTLLDIQEQLLTNTYPALRTGHQPAMPNPSVPQAPVTMYTPPPSEPAAAEVEASPIKVRKVSLDDLAPQQPAEPHYEDHRYVEEASDGVDMEEYRRWVIRTIKEVGLKETRNLIRDYGYEGEFSPAVRDELLQVAAQYAAKQQAKAQHRKPAPPQSAPAVRPPAAHAQPVYSQQTPAQPAPAQPVHTHPQPRQTRSKAKASVPVYTSDDDLTRPSRNAVMAPPQPAPEPLPDEMETNSSLILRLMAGIQNAGAGVKWSKKNHG